ncbi:ubiquitin domain-containing protein UBFD1-like [Littorina saxatilis]|uniref:Ubiquitin-like domain-containing protein n=1 Tax=Littorina saxatilis TaxID=31220 RepID=A0AAN9BV88_9CAEN
MATEAENIDTGAAGDEPESKPDPSTANNDDSPVEGTEENDAEPEKPEASGASCGTSDMGNIVAQETDTSSSETVDFKVIFNKQKFDVSMQIDSTIEQLKAKTHVLTGVPPSMQKIMFRGLAKDHQTLRELKVIKGAKIMVVGSTLNDVLSVTKPTEQEMKEAAKTDAAATKEPLTTQKVHKKVLDKYGKPDDALPGVKNIKQPLPHTPLTGMYNKSGNKVRLTFKMEADQIWIGTKERTDKIPMNSVKQVVSEAMDGHEEYHLLGLQLGPTEASRYWIYWVPAQYVDAVKDAILGKWQFF